MEITGSTYGLGIDEPACLEIQEGTKAKVHGKGRVYYIARKGPLKFKVKALEPGDSFKIV